MSKPITEHLGINPKKTDELYQLLNAVSMAAARIRAENAMQGAKALIDHGYTNPKKVLDSGYWDKVKVLNENGYARYDESRARFLEENAKILLEKYEGNVHKLLDEAGHKTPKIKELVQQFYGIGPLGAEIFVREIKPHIKLSMYYGKLPMTKLADVLPVVATAPYTGLDTASTLAGVSGTVADAAHGAHALGNAIGNGGSLLSAIQQIPGVANLFNEGGKLAPIAPALEKVVPSALPGATKALGLLDKLAPAAPFLKKVAPPLAIADFAAETTKNGLYPEASRNEFLNNINGRNWLYRGFKGFTNPVTTLNAFDNQAEQTAKMVSDQHPLLQKLHETVNNPMTRNTLGPLRTAANVGAGMSAFVQQPVNNAVDYVKHLMNAPTPPKPIEPVVPKPPTIPPKPTPMAKMFAAPHPTPAPKPMGTPAPQFGKPAPQRPLSM